MTRRLINPRMHLALDVATIASFLLAPTLLHLETGPRALAYVLAVAHTLLTLAVQAMQSRFERLTARVHSAVELTVGAALLVVPFATSWGTVASWFFGIAGCTILAVVACTDYTAHYRSVAAP